MRPLKRFVRRILSHFDGVLFGQPDEHRVQRFFWSSCMGFVLACTYWELVLSALGIPTKWENGVYTGLLLFLGIGYPTSVRIRCTCLLVCIGFFGKAGRSYMKAIMFGLIIAGPINNIMMNCKEMVRVFECSARLTYNLTKTRYDLLTAPFRHSLHQLPKNVSQINRSFDKITFIVHPLREEMLNESSANRDVRHDEPNASDRMFDHEAKAQRIQSNYVHKIRGRCVGQLERGRDKCLKAFRKAYDRCMDKLPVVVNTMLCWPMKMSFMCKMVMPNGEDICDPKAHLDATMGADFVEMEQSVNLMNPVQVNASSAEAESSFRLIKKKSKETSARVMRDVNRKWRIVSAFMYLMRKVLAWTFIKVVKSAIAYRRKYSNDIDFDNVYISKYFQRVDARRRSTDKRALLPMKKIERSNLMRITSCKRTRQEFWSMMVQLCKASLEMLTAACFLLLDHLMAVGMQIVADHALVEFNQEGEHLVDIQVNGTGIIAQMVRKAVAGANIDVEFKLSTNNDQCLPRPSHMATFEYVKILLLFIMVLILIYIEAYLQRMRHCVAAYFYFRREKQRVLHAYNLSLKKRRGLLRQTLAQVEEQLRYGGRSAIWFGGMCHRVPMCWWLRWLPVCRRYCIICTDPEPFRMNRKLFEECMVCRTIYCVECWKEMGTVCVVCRKLGRKRAGGEEEEDYYWSYAHSNADSSTSSDSDV